MPKVNKLRLVISIVLTFTAGFLGSFFTTPSIPTWYAFLNKPFFQPPNWLFGPVWTVLYILMGISLAIIWTKVNKKKIWLVYFFLVHLLVNSFWSIAFFGMHNLLLALLVIFILWGMILTLIVEFKKVDKIASYLLYPYIAWVSFASILNFAVWFLNK